MQTNRVREKKNRKKEQIKNSDKWIEVTDNEITSITKGEKVMKEIEEEGTREQR